MAFIRSFPPQEKFQMTNHKSPVRTARPGGQINYKFQIPEKFQIPKRFEIISVIIVCQFLVQAAIAQTPLITNINSRNTISLNGKWQYIVDPYETGFYNYRYQERDENDKEAYWSSDVPENKTDRKEHGYIDKYSLNVPGDWNSQDPKFLYYEGTVWYKKSFDFDSVSSSSKRVFLYFGAVNYRADVYLNSKKLGMHKGGFTPFNFEIPAGLLKTKGNFLVVKVDNKRAADEVPTLNTDWWNYGGITRDVKLVILPKTFIRDYFITLSKSSLNAKNKIAEGWIKLSEPFNGVMSIGMSELSLQQSMRIMNGDSMAFKLELRNAQLWSPENPKLYSITITAGEDRVQDKLGFRTIEVRNKQVLLNEKPIFLRGICMHEEIDGRRANSAKDALRLLQQVKELNANMCRLAHYPHNENMVRAADSMGILLWCEIPVYWTIDFSSNEVWQKARMQLTEMITRDHNRASVIIWSVGNETPVNEARTNFMARLVHAAKEMDSSRIVSAALEVHNVNGVNTIDDPLGAYTDIVSVNEYLGWYGGLPSNARTAKWDVKYDKPLFFSETGAEALGGFHGDSLTRWSEEYQEWYYREQVSMMKRMPDNFVGLSPWILNDFRSPRRNNPIYQEGWNNKGLFDHHGKKKKAFYVLKEYYTEVNNK
jgi:beta-glucuronidase